MNEVAEVSMKKTALVFLMALAVAGVSHADRTVNETRPLAADGRVEVSNISGEVEVIGWTGDGVTITGRLEDGVKELSVSSGGASLSIEVELERRTRNNGSAYLTIKVPKNASLDIETVSADISVDGVVGELDLESVSGRVEISGDTRSVEASSVSGDVIVASTAASSELETVSGDIIVRRATGRLDASVVSGNIEIEGGALDSFDGETVSGSIFCAASPTDRGRFTIETMSGTIDLVVSPEIDADFSIETYSGSIKNDIGPSPRRTDEHGPGKELRFTAGSGGARISVESFSGSVKLRTN
jgi:DUF4097 and DUF4098 domain-containing protein YvlB